MEEVKREEVKREEIEKLVGGALNYWKDSITQSLMYSSVNLMKNVIMVWTEDSNLKIAGDFLFDLLGDADISEDEITDIIHEVECYHSAVPSEEDEFPAKYEKGINFLQKFKEYYFLYEDIVMNTPTLRRARFRELLSAFRYFLNGTGEDLTIPVILKEYPGMREEYYE